MTKSHTDAVWNVDVMLADSAVVAEGKLFVQGGGWNALNPVAIPAPFPRISLGIIVHVPYTATNRVHQLEVRLEHEDGDLVALAFQPGPEGPEAIQRVGGDFNVGRPPQLLVGDEQLIPIAMTFDGVVFDRPGGYAFVLEIDGAEVSRQRFRVQTPGFQQMPVR